MNIIVGGLEVHKFAKFVGEMYQIWYQNFISSDFEGDFFLFDDLNLFF